MKWNLVTEYQDKQDAVVDADAGKDEEAVADEEAGGDEEWYIGLESQTNMD